MFKYATSPANQIDTMGKAPRSSLPLMTPRNLVPATPMRFNSDNSGANLDKQSVSKVGKGPQRDKSKIPLPPGYVDRSAQRRSGASRPELSDIFELDSTKNTLVDDSDIKGAKLKFLEESAGALEFPSCKNVQFERLMKSVLTPSSPHVKESNEKSAFRPNEAYLQFKSISEAKTQPFDPFHRPRKVFRASSRVEKEDDSEVIERVREAMKRLKNFNERNQKYLETLAAVNKTQNDNETDDIFPEAGRFDESSVLESVIKQSTVALQENSVKAKAKSRLFGTKKQQPQAQETEVDVFELIAQKSLDEKKPEKEVSSFESGGLFGFSNVLPKLSRLEEENADKRGSKLTGAYASLLSDDDGQEGEDGRLQDTTNVAVDKDINDDYLYPGHLENDSMNFDSDEEDTTGTERPVNNKRKLARREDKDAAKVEKLVKSKFGVDLSK